MSTMVPMYGFGGGSGGLNFTVVGGTTAPSNPKENMIWVNTSTAITDWVFSATQPTAASGRVWIFTGTSSTVEFNALKKNGIQVYPIRAKQYIGGAWVNVTAMSYQDGKWSEWTTYLYNKGETAYNFTVKGMKSESSAAALGVAPTITKNSDNVYIKIEKGSNANGSAGIAYISEKADLTNASTLCVEGDFYQDYNKEFPMFCVWSSIGTYSNENIKASKSIVSALETEETKLIQLDVSNLTGSYNIGIRMLSTESNSYARIRQIYYW